MAADPVFAASPNVGSGLVPATADTSRTGPTNATTVWTAGANGGKVEEIIMQGVGTTVLGVVCVFRHDGSTYHLIDEFTIQAVTPSTTVVAHRERRTYDNLVLEAAETIRVTTQIAGNQSLVKVTVLGGDF